MTYRVDLTARASRDLKHIYRSIGAATSERARAWFDRLEVAILGLERHPSRCPATPENSGLRHLLFGRQRYIYRIIFKIDDPNGVVTIVHIRHGSRRPMPAVADE